MSYDAAYAGLLVLDLSRGAAATHCGMLLAQHSADVIKVEPMAGDWARDLGAQYGQDSVSCRRCRAQCLREPWRTRTERVGQRRLQPYQRAPQYSVIDAMSPLAWVALMPRPCERLTSLPTEPGIRLERLPAIRWERSM